MSKPLSRSNYLSTEGIGDVPLESVWCAVCDAPVKRIVRDRDIESMTYLFEFHCHGKVEKAHLTDREVFGVKIELIECFRSEREVLDSSAPRLSKGLPK